MKRSQAGSPEGIRVLIADDHTVVREGLRTFLGMLPDIQLVGEASTGVEVLKLVSSAAPQVVLMDLVMPDLDGIEATRRLKKDYPEVQVIVLTSFTDDDKLYPAIKAGAVSYLLKDVQPQELSEAVRAAARGEARLAPEVTRRLMDGISEPAQTVELLTGREREVLACLGEGMSNRTIGERLFISEKTVKTHVSNILDKLDLVDRTQAALFAVRNGVVLKVDDPSSS